MEHNGKQSERVEIAPLATVEEAAKVLRLHSATILRYLRHKKMPGFKIAGEWRIARKTLEQMAEGKHPHE